MYAHNKGESIKTVIHSFKKKKKKNWISVVRRCVGSLVVVSMFGHTLSTHFDIICVNLSSFIQFSFPLLILWKILHPHPLRCCVQTRHPSPLYGHHIGLSAADCLTFSYHLRDSLVFQYILLDASTSMDTISFSFFALLCVYETNNASRRRVLWGFWKFYYHLITNVQHSTAYLLHTF